MFGALCLSMISGHDPIRLISIIFRCAGAAPHTQVAEPGYDVILVTVIACQFRGDFCVMAFRPT